MRGTARSSHEWESLVSRSFVPLVVDAVTEVDGGFLGRVDSRPIGQGASVNRVEALGSRLHRDPGADGGDSPPSVLFVMHRRGEGRVEQFDRRSIQRPGSFVHYVSDAPYSLEFAGTMAETVILVPGALLSTPWDRVRSLAATTFMSDAAVNGLHAYARALLEGDSAVRVDRLGATVAYLVDSALALRVGKELGPPSDAVLLTRAEQLIKVRASDPTLSPDAIASALHISRRRLYAIFDGAGYTPAARIRTARTDLAVTMLETEPHSALASVWQRAGFSDQRTFFRAVLDRTGMSPSAFQRDAFDRRAAR